MPIVGVGQVTEADSAQGLNLDKLSDAPNLTVQIAFASNPGATPIWTDISDFVLAWSIKRGRQHELDRPQAGTGTLVLNNWDRRFEPLNSAGPYFPNVVPMRRVRIRGTWQGNVYDVFHSFIESWPLAYEDGGFQETVSLALVDAFKALASVKLDATYAQQLSGTRVNAVLDSAGWPAADRDVDAGKSDIQGVTLDDKPALEHLLDVATAELGLLFISRDGKVTFIDRHAFFTGTEDYANHTWGDSGAEFAYEDVVLDFDDSNIWNEVKVTRTGGTEQVVSNSASQTKYLRRTLVRSGLLITTDNEALDQANYLLSRYKEVEIRASRLNLRPQMDTSQWPHVLHHDLGDKIRIRRRPVAGGLIEQEVFIQGIAHSWDKDTGWRVSWDLSPVDPTAGFWILGDTLRGVLDSTTKLGV